MYRLDQSHDKSVAAIVCWLLLHTEAQLGWMICLSLSGRLIIHVWCTLPSRWMPSQFTVHNYGITYDRIFLLWRRNWVTYLAMAVKHKAAYCGSSSFFRAFANLPSGEAKRDPTYCRHLCYIIICSMLSPVLHTCNYEIVYNPAPRFTANT